MVKTESWNELVVAATFDLNEQPPCNMDGNAIGSICLHLRADRNGRFGRTHNSSGGGNNNGGRRGRGGGRAGGRNNGRGGTIGAGGDRFGPARGAANEENRAPADSGEGTCASAAPAAAGGG